MKTNLKNVFEYSNGLNIRAIYDFFRSEGCSVKESLSFFVDSIRSFVVLGYAKLEFRTWVSNKLELDNSSIDTQLDFIINSFPVEYDEAIPEKDIDNLWWYFDCPVDIGWLQDDNSYVFSG